MSKPFDGTIHTIQPTISPKEKCMLDTLTWNKRDFYEPIKTRPFRGFTEKVYRSASFNRTFELLIIYKRRLSCKPLIKFKNLRSNFVINQIGWWHFSLNIALRSYFSPSPSLLVLVITLIKDKTKLVNYTPYDCLFKSSFCHSPGACN